MIRNYSVLGQHVFDFGPLIVPGTPNDLVVYPVSDNHILQHPRLCICAIDDRNLRRAASARNQTLELAGDETRFLMLVSTPQDCDLLSLSLIHISEPTRLR